MKTIQKLAREASGFLRRGEREEDGIGKILVPADDAPAWLQPLCMAAHGGASNMLPDDWRYEFIGNALDVIGKGDDDESEDALRERAEEFIDGAYVCTSQQTAWLASHAFRPGYCDDAAHEYDIDPGTSIYDRIALGMRFEFFEVFGFVRDSLSDLAEEQEEAEA